MSDAAWPCPLWVVQRNPLLRCIPIPYAMVLGMQAIFWTFLKIVFGRCCGPSQLGRLSWCATAALGALCYLPTVYATRPSDVCYARLQCVIDRGSVTLYGKLDRRL